MRHTATLAIVLLAILTAGAALYTFRKSFTTQTVPQRIVEAFSRWQQKYQRLYASPAEQAYRLGVFQDQTLFIERKNIEYEDNARKAGVILNGAAHEMNMFGDLTNEEFRVTYTGAIAIEAEYIQQEVITEDQIKELQKRSQNPQWIEKSSLGQGWYPRIRQQGSCGCCWAFSAVQELERLVFNAYGGQSIDLSQQELVDCVTGCNGCHGGHPEHAFNYVKDGGIHRLSNYPYITNRGVCRNQTQGKIKFDGLRPSKFQNFNAAKAQMASNNRIQAAVMVKAEGAFRYQANNRDIYDAKWSNECNQVVTHAVSMWEFNGDVINIVNSWGTSWGFNGMKLIRTCGHDNVWGLHGRIAYPYDSF